MTTRQDPLSPRSFYLYLLIILLVGFNLRPVLASVGPLLKFIQQDTGMSYQIGGLMTTLPVMVMGALSLFANWIYRCGVRRGVLYGLGLIALACALRLPHPSSTSLLLSAVLSGVGIGFLQTLMPGYIKSLPIGGVERLMGLYVTMIMGGAAFTFFVSPQLMLLMSWQEALGVWLVPAGVAFVVWWKQTTGYVEPTFTPVSTTVTSMSKTKSLWADARAWLLASIFIISSAAFTLLLAWFAPFYMSLGWTAQGAGAKMSVLMCVEVSMGLLIANYVPSMRDKRKPFMACLIVAALGYLLMLLAPVSLSWLVVLCLGIGVGAIFPLSIMIVMTHSSNPQRAGKLAAFVQGVGYLVAGIMPWVAGVLRDGLGSFDYAWLFIMALMILAIPLVWRLSPQTIQAYDSASTGLIS